MKWFTNRKKRLEMMQGIRPTSKATLKLQCLFCCKGDIDEAIVWYYNAAYECSSILDVKKSGTFPRLALAKCYRKLGNEEQALDYEREASELEEDR